MISKAIESFDWDKVFSGKSADEEASVLTNATLNIMSNIFLKK